MPKFFARLIVALFICVLWLPLLDQCLQIDPYPAPYENRWASPFPLFPGTHAEIEKYPGKYEAYRNDHFGFRNLLLYNYSSLKAYVLQTSPSKWVLVGKEGWLFLGERSTLNAYRTPAPFSEVRLKRMLDITQERAEWCATRGIVYGSWWAPEKHFVYPEFLPGWVAPIHEPFSMVKWVEYAQREGAAPVYSLLPPLLEVKKDHQAYFRGDSHWNSYGAYAAYRSIMESIVAAGIETRVVAPEDLEQRHMREGADLAQVANISKAYPGPVTGVRPRRGVSSWPNWLKRSRSAETYVVTNRNQSLPKLVLFGDSFCINVLPFLAESFRTIVYVRDRVFVEEIIKRQRPDVVLELFAARQLEGDMPLETLPVPEWRH